MKELEHLDIESINGTKINLDALYQIMPSAFTETRDEKTGELRKAINFNTLRELLGDDAVDKNVESYEFTWVGKQAARAEAARPTDKTLRPVPEDSLDWDKTKNIYIEGDNLEVLKLLQKSYMGKVKMIYIDPPYNTGNDFVYHDDFSQDVENYRLESGETDELGNKFVKNPDSNGRFHSDWCSMMYPRLMVARSLLSDDGVIFISIGVEELSTLKSICNEIFGEKNFVEIFSWVKTSTPPSLAVKSRKTNEYILCYEKNKNNIKYNGELLDGGDQPLLNSGNPLSVLLFPKDKVVFKTKNFPDGVYGPYCKDRVSLLDEIEIEDGYAKNDFRLKGEFKWSQQFFDEEVTKGTTFVIKTDNLSVRFIRDGEGYKRPTNFIKEHYTTPVVDKPGVGVGTNESASSYLINLMDGNNVFSYPKPVSLIKYLMNFVCKDGDLVLDFFSGSSTTGDSAMRFSVDKQISLRYIMVQLPEDLDENLKTAEPVSREIICNGINFLNKYGKPHKLTELAKIRLKKTGQNIKSFIDGSNCDTGFRVFRLGDSYVRNVAKSPKQFCQGSIEFDIDNINRDGYSDMGLLFECMIKWGVQLSLPMAKETVDGCDIYNVNDGDLVACFSDNITDEVVKTIAAKNPLRVVFRDSCFNRDDAKINIFETFKQMLDWSDDEVVKNVRVI